VLLVHSDFQIISVKVEIFCLGSYMVRYKFGVYCLRNVTVEVVVHNYKNGKNKKGYNHKENFGETSQH
jgi:hypothetical protein